MSGFTSGLQRQVIARVVGLLKKAAGPFIALGIYYHRYMERLPLFLKQWAKFATDVEFWLVAFAAITGFFAEPNTAALLVVVALLSWALVLIKRARNHSDPESPSGTPPAGEQSIGKVVDLDEHKARDRRRDDRGGGSRRAA